MIMMMLLGPGLAVWDLDDDNAVGTISSKSKMAAAMIYYSLLMIFLIRITLFIDIKLKFIEPVIADC